MTERRALARLARRSIMSAPLRSALLVVLVALLVGGGTAFAVFIRSTQLLHEDHLNAMLGAANTSVEFAAVPASLDEKDLLPVTDADALSWHQAFEQRDGLSSLRDMFGVPTLLVRSGFLGQGAGSGPFGQAGFSHQRQVFWGLDMSHPLAQDRLYLVEGRFPTGAGELAVSRESAMRSGYGLGEVVRFGDTSLTVVGVVFAPSWQFDQPWVVTPNGFDKLNISPRSLHYQVLADVDESDVERVVSDAESIVGHFIEGNHRERQLERDDLGEIVLTNKPVDTQPFRLSAGVTLVLPNVLTVTFATLLVLIGAVVFAVSIRRRAHELGQLIGIGASEEHLRRLLRYEAGWLGLAGASLGIAGALGLMSLAVEMKWVVGEFYFPTVRFGLRDLFGPAVVGILSILVAARWAAAKLEDWSSVSAVSGVLPVSDPIAMRARWGLVCLAVGFVIPTVILMTEVGGLVYGFFVVGAMMLGFVGVLILANAALAAVARRAEHLPLLLRLVIRSTGRQRGRAAVVIGILSLVVAVPILVGSSTEPEPLLDYSIGEKPWEGIERTSVRSGSGSRSESSVEFANRVFTVEAVTSGAPDPNGKTNIVDDLGEVQGGLLEAAASRFGPVDAADLLQLEGSVYWEASPRDFRRAGDGTVYIATQDIIDLFGLDDDSVADLDRGALVDVSGQDWTVEGEMVIRTSRFPVSSIVVVDGPRVFFDRGVFLMSPEAAGQIGAVPFRVGAIYVAEQSIMSDQRVLFIRDANAIWVEQHGEYLPGVYDEAASFCLSQPFGRVVRNRRDAR